MTAGIRQARAARPCSWYCRCWVSCLARAPVMAAAPKAAQDSIITRTAGTDSSWATCKLDQVGKATSWAFVQSHARLLWSADPQASGKLCCPETRSRATWPGSGAYHCSTLQPKQPEDQEWPSRQGVAQEVHRACADGALPLRLLTQPLPGQRTCAAGAHMACGWLPAQTAQVQQVRQAQPTATDRGSRLCSLRAWLRAAV